MECRNQIIVYLGVCIVRFCRKSFVSLSPAQFFFDKDFVVHKIHGSFHEKRKTKFSITAPLPKMCVLISMSMNASYIIHSQL